METVNVSSLKNNPSEALRLARKDVVVVNRDRPAFGARARPAGGRHGVPLPDPGSFDCSTICAPIRDLCE